MTDDRPARRFGPRVWIALAAALALVAVVAVVVAVTGQQSPPKPAAATGDRTETSAPATSEPAGPPAGEPSPTEEPDEPEAPVAEPVSMSIPSIDVTSDLLRLGLNADNTVEVPPLGADDQAGWYEQGPAPGATGPAILLGHVDSADFGPGIFFDLGGLKPADEITVKRADGSTAVFAVDRVETYPKKDFPTIEVYGNTDDAQLRLITCGGDFDSSARSYEDNVVAYATLVDVRTA